MRLGNKRPRNKARHVRRVKQRNQHKHRPRKLQLNLQNNPESAATAIRRAAIKASAINVNAWLS